MLRLAILAARATPRRHPGLEPGSDGERIGIGKELRLPQRSRLKAGMTSEDGA
jgi:hypothetical protein